MKKLLIIPVLALALVSCRNRNAAPTTATDSLIFGTVADAHNARNSLDYAGTYRGVLPCADCSGIDVTITLDGNGNYTKSVAYQGKEHDNTFFSTGHYEWNEAGSVITLIDEMDPPMFLVGENRLFMLDINGQRMTGELADRYILNRVE